MDEEIKKIEGKIAKAKAWFKAQHKIVQGIVAIVAVAVVLGILTVLSWIFPPNEDVHDSQEDAIYKVMDDGTSKS